MNPSVSVVLPVRDGEQFLEEALRSVLQQTYRDLEVIVVDDHSVDSSPAIIRAAAEIDDRVRLVASSGSGISAALNTGFREARGDWVARMDADDVCRVDRIERQIAASRERPDVIAWASWGMAIDAAGRTISSIRTGPTSDQELRRTLASGGIIAILHSTVLVRRDNVLNAGGYDSQFDGAEDVELWDRIVDSGPILALPVPLVLCRAHANSYSTERLARGVEIHQFVAARRRARTAGRVLSFEEFVQARAAAPSPVRLARHLAVLGRLHYRAAGNHYAAGQLLRCSRRLICAAALNPIYTFGALRRQVLRRDHRLQEQAGSSAR